MDRKKIKELEDIAYAPYERIDKPTAEDWKKSYDALKELCELVPDEGMYPNTLGYSIPCAPALWPELTTYYTTPPNIFLRAFSGNNAVDAAFFMLSN